MQKIAEHILKALANHPEAVRVTSADDGDRTTLTVKVDATDTGRVIGRQGRTINALRTVVRAAGLRRGRRVELDLLEPDED